MTSAADSFDAKSSMSTVEAEGILAGWTEAMNTACMDGSTAAITELFLEDSWWRDALALTWDLRTTRGRDQIERMLEERLDIARPRDFRLDVGKTTVVPGPDGKAVLQGLLSFEVADGPCRGVVKMRRGDGGAWRVWVFFGFLQAINGVEELSPSWDDLAGDQFKAPVPGRRHYSEQVADESSFANTDPDVLIIGAGHMGVGLAARLQALGMSYLVVDREQRLGDNWRLRYANLQLHDPVFSNHFPYLSFPVGAKFPVMLPKDKVASWIEAYVTALDLNVWIDSEVVGGSYDSAADKWSVQVRQGNGVRTLEPRHVVVATGICGAPKIPDLPGLDEAICEVVHSSEFTDARDHVGKKAFVVGTGNSGHDIAQDLAEQGADVTIVQRSSTYILSTENGVGTLYRNFKPGGMSLDDIDLVQSSMAFPLILEVAESATDAIAEADRDLIESLEAVGFKTNREGLTAAAVRNLGGYYINQGCSQLIIDGTVGLKQAAVEGFSGDQVLFDDGTAESADLVVMATGFNDIRETARTMFGDEVADRCDPVWGIDETRLEPGSFWRDSGHPRLWFHAGSFSWSRVYSRVLALQLVGIDRGIFEQPSVLESALDRQGV